MFDTLIPPLFHFLLQAQEQQGARQVDLMERLVADHEVQMAKVIETQEYQTTLLERMTAAQEQRAQAATQQAQAMTQQASALAQQSSALNSLVLHLLGVRNLHQ